MDIGYKKKGLVDLEWRFFDRVQNEGGRAGCQDDPKTFRIMRESQFSPWPERLVDCYLNDLYAALLDDRNPLADKYAWMMKDTAPEAFSKIEHLLSAPSEEAEELIAKIVSVEVKWFSEYCEKYPMLARGNRAVSSDADSPYGGTSFETYLRGELHTYSVKTLREYLKFIDQLSAEGKSLSLLVTDSMVRAYGYDGLEDAEAVLRKAAEGKSDADVT